MERRKFAREFKRKTVKLIRERGVPAAQSSRDLGAHGTVCADVCRSVLPMRRRPFRARSR
jgi:transposase-like protein